MFSFKFFHLIKFCLSFQPECCLKSFLPIVPFFQYFRRQCVVGFHQVSFHLLKFMFNSFHLQSECCPNYIIIIHSYLVSTRVVPFPSCPLYSSFIAFQPPRFTWCSLFLFSTVVLSIVFNSVVFFLSTFQPLKVHWFHSFVKEATLSYLFLFRFSPVPS